MFLQQVINGIMLGSTYSLVAIGYSLVFGVIKIVNLSNGSFYMLGSFSYTINIQHLLSLVKLLNTRRIHRNVRL